jgi:hypothetical protein
MKMYDLDTYVDGWSPYRLISSMLIWVGPAATATEWVNIILDICTFNVQYNAFSFPPQNRYPAPFRYTMIVP